jgi:carboxyl-terminal processing protease
VDTIDVDSITELLIPKLLDELDPHSVYIPAKDLKRSNEELNGNFGGVGVQFRMFDDTVMVMHVIDGGPSQKVGIKDGDRLIAVDDSIIAGVDFQNNDVMDALRGKRGTEVKVTAYRPSEGKSIDFNITRGSIPVNSVEVSYMLDDKTGYVNVARFGQHTYNEFLLAITGLKQQGATSIVVDLRGNGGGLLSAAIGMVNEFLKRGEMIVYTDGKAQRRQEYKADGSGSCQNMRLAVLLDEWSASASEIFAGAIQDHDRGIVIGRRSFGKGLVQNQQKLADGSALRLTIARYYTPSGRCIQKTYEKGAESYAVDLWKRYEHGELDNKDSISFKNTKSFTTQKGRTVYDSGGIMSDIFIPRDTVGVTDFSRKVSRKGLVVRYAFFYVDQHRDALSAIANEGGVDALLAYLKQQQLMPGLLALAKEKEITPKGSDLMATRKVLETQVYAFIAQNVMDSEGFYPIISELDNTILEAIKIMRLSEEEFQAKIMSSDAAK